MRERRKREEEEREMIQGNEGNRVPSAFIYASGPGRSIPGPLPLSCVRWIKILMDLDQSNAVRALV